MALSGLGSGMAGGARAVLQASPTGAVQPGDGWILAWSVRGSNIGAARGHDDLLATVRLHKDVPILTTPRDRYVA
jgi:hypothetical protein